MKWTDIQAIAIELEDKYPLQDKVNLRFADLRDWIITLDGFDDAAGGCSEKILEVIQMVWIDERED